MTRRHAAPRFRNLRIRLAYARARYGRYLLTWAAITAAGSAVLAAAVLVAAAKAATP